MDNEFIKNIVELSPRLALLVGCIGVVIWVVKSLMEIRSKRHISKLNKKVLEVTLSSVKSKELIDKLNFLQDSISELEKASKLVSDGTFLSNIERVDKRIDALLDKLPKDWAYQKNINVSIEWINELSNTVQFLKNIPASEVSLNESTFQYLVEDFSKKTEVSFFVIEELISTISRYRRQSDETINWISTIKGAGALSILLVFSFGIVSYNQIQKEITSSGNRFADLAREKESEIVQLRQSLASSQKHLEVSESKVGALAENLASLKKERDIVTSNLAVVNERVATITQSLRAGGGGELVDEFKELGSLLEEIDVTGTEDSTNFNERIMPEDGEIEFRLNWNGRDDLDLMLSTPNGEMVTYRNPVSRSLKGRLLGDVRQGPGEEKIVLKNPVDGKYIITVSNYSKKDDANYKISIFVDNKVTILKRGVVLGAPERFNYTLQKDANN